MTDALHTVSGPRVLPVQVAPPSEPGVPDARKEWALPKAWSVIIASALVLILGWLDMITGWELSLFVFYAAPILLLAWYGNRSSAILFALICSVTWWLANGNEHPYMTKWGYFGASLSRLVYFLFVAIGGTALRLKREAERERLVAMERASELEREIVRISEAEQQRIGQDLHDGLCQYLAGVKCAVGMLRHELASKKIPQSARLSEIEKMMGDAITQTRDMARGISPVMCNEEGLAAALEDLTASSAKLFGQKINLQVEGEVSEHDPKRAHHLYRIAQEALGNALRHSEARSIQIILSGNPESLTLTVSDDGKGMDGPPRGSRGLGLRTMAYRARVLGADFAIKRSPSGGTMVECRSPRL